MATRGGKALTYTGEPSTSKFEAPPSVMDERQKRGLDALEKVIFYSTAAPTAPIGHQRTIFDMGERTKTSASIGPRSHTRSMLSTSVPSAPWSHMKKKPVIKPAVKPTKPKPTPVFKNIIPDDPPVERVRKHSISKHTGRVSPKPQHNADRDMRDSPGSSSASSPEARDTALPQQIVTPALPQQILTPALPQQILTPRPTEMEGPVRRQSSPINPTAAYSPGKLLPRRKNMQVAPPQRIYKAPHRRKSSEGMNGTSIVTMSSIELYDDSHENP